jgi:hypothetical protein
MKREKKARDRGKKLRNFALKIPLKTAGTYNCTGFIPK